METRRRIMCEFCEGHGRVHWHGFYKDAKECSRCLGLKIVVEVTKITFEPIDKYESPLRKQGKGL